MNDLELYDECQRLFEYKAGELIRKRNVASMARKGDSAGWKQGEYVRLKINGQPYLRHRIIFLMHYKHLPEFIDHIHGVSKGDFIWNLREATKSQNAVNSKIRRNNTSGFKGVSWHKDNRKWCARIRFNNKRIHLGSFNDINEAKNAYNEKSIELFGEFANNGDNK